MKILKKQGLTLMLVVALIVTLTLGIIFMFPVKTESVSAEETDFFANAETKTVSDETALRSAVKEATTTPTVIQLENNIELTTLNETEDSGYALVVEREQIIKLDLAGHTLSVPAKSEGVGNVIVNKGTLSVVDTSVDEQGVKNYQGEVVSNGYVSTTTAFGQSKEGDIYWLPAKAVINNFGTLSLDAKLSIHIPKAGGNNESFNTSGHIRIYDWGTNENIYDADAYLVRNQLDVAPSGEDQTILPASLTLEGGIYDLGYKFDGSRLNIYYPMNHFFLLCDANLTVNGGTFRNTLQGNPAFYGGFLAEIRTLGEQSPDIEPTIKDYRQIDITVNDGDFSSEKLSDCWSDDPALLYTKNYEPATEGDGLSVLISGGVFPIDVSAYVDADHKMVERDGCFVVAELTEEEKQNAAVYLEQDGEPAKPIGWYNTFEEGWTAAWLHIQMGQDVIIKLQKDITTESLVFEHATNNKSVALDLDGHELQVTQTYEGNPSSDVSHVRVTNYGGSSGPSTVATTFIVRDTSVEQDGTLNLVYSEKAQSLGAISLSDELKFVLESGTITRTGGGFSYGPDLGKVYKSIFYLAESIVNQKAITIKGGNILTQLDGEDQGYLVSAYMCSGNNSESYYDLNEYKADFDMDLADYLSGTSGKECHFSWDVSPLLPQGYTCMPQGDFYRVYYIGENKYSVGTNLYENLSDAIAATADSVDKTILMIAADELTEAVTLENATLDLNVYQKFTLTAPSVTLKGTAAIKNGTVQGTVVAEGSASFENFELQGNLTVKSNAQLTITEGVYNGEVTVENGANFKILGGTFRGDQIKTVDSYFGFGLGSYKEISEADYAADKMYDVKIAPNLAAQKWYSTNAIADAQEVGIHDKEEWLYFSMYVNSGLDSFAGQKIKLMQDIDFSADPASEIALYAAGDVTPNFLPAGNAQHSFGGTFDGNNKIMSGIVAQEIMVGLFGATSSAMRVVNITVKDSSFTAGSGYLDEYNRTAIYCAAAIIGEGFMGGNEAGTDWSGNITLDNVKIDYTEDVPGLTVFFGGVIAHSYGSVKIDGVNLTNRTTVRGKWKVGGVVGYVDGVCYIKNADIEQGKDPDGSDNGLILDVPGVAGALIGHSNNGQTTFENCTVLEPDDSLIATTSDSGKNCEITIKGSQTNLDIYKVVGAGREGGTTNIELSGDVTEEDGVQMGSFQTQEKEDYLSFFDSEGQNITEEVKQNSSETGGYTAKASYVVEVSIGGLVGEMTRGDGTLNLTVSDFTLYDIYGNPVDPSLYGNITVTVTLKDSAYNVGKQVALITSYTVSGEDAVNFNFLPIGNQAFIEVDVQAATLTVSVNSDGTISYDGFVGGENESVLGGQLKLDRVDNGDGTYTVTPSGLTSENYNIVYVSGIVPMMTQEAPASNGNNVLWIVLAVMGGVAVLGAAAVVFAVRRKKN